MISGFWEGSAFILPFMFTIIMHEIAHGYTAMKLGDKTAYLMGRLTLNPIAHIDPFGSIIFPFILIMAHAPFLFGWAKPVPVNFAALNNPKKDMGIVALAGPLMNMLIALGFAVLLKLALKFLPHTQVTDWIILNFQNGVMISLVLAAFNLFPVLPLDGGRILMSILPNKWSFKYAQSEKYGFVILITLLIFLPMFGNLLNLNLDVIHIYIRWMMDGMLRMLSFVL